MKRKQMERKAQFQKELQRRNNVIRRLREQQQLAFKQKQARMERQKRKKAKKQMYLKRQKQNLIQVGNMLRQIDQKIKESSSQLQQNLKEIRNELSPKNKMQPFKVIKIIPNKFSQSLDQNDFEGFANQFLELSGSKACKLPVVLYNNRYYDARSYFADSNNVPSQIERVSSEDNAQDVQNIVKILKKNQQRIKMLIQDNQFNQ